MYQSGDGEVIIITEQRVECACFNNCLLSRIPAGELLTDNAGNKWKLGTFLNRGGFGSVYLGIYSAF